MAVTLNVIGAGADHGAEHLPVGGAQVVSLVDHDMAVPVVVVPHTGTVVHGRAPATTFVPKGLTEFRVVFRLEAGSALSGLTSRLPGPGC